MTAVHVLASFDAGWMTGKQRNMWRPLQSMGRLSAVLKQGSPPTDPQADASQGIADARKALYWLLCCVTHSVAASCMPGHPQRLDQCRKCQTAALATQCAASHWARLTCVVLSPCSVSLAAPSLDQASSVSNWH